MSDRIHKRDVLQQFNAMRGAGASPNFTPESPAEAATVELYGTALAAAGVGLAEMVTLFTRHALNPAHSPAFPLPWPSPGALLSYRAGNPAAAIAESELIRVFKKLQDIAHDCGTITDGKGNHQDMPGYLRTYSAAQGRNLTWDEMFAERVAHQFGELSPAVAAALDAVGGHVGLTEQTRTEFDRSHARRAFVEAVRAGEARGLVGAMAPKQLTQPEPRQQLQIDDPGEDALPPKSVSDRIPLLRQAMRGGRSVLPRQMSQGELLERREALKQQRVDLEARGLA